MLLSFIESQTALFYKIVGVFFELMIYGGLSKDEIPHHQRDLCPSS
jgi:hypothetical protein